MNEEYLIGLDEYKELDESSPLGYTRDIRTCICALLHKENSTILMHIEAYDDSDIKLSKFKDLLTEEVKLCQLFVGPSTTKINLDLVTRLVSNYQISVEVYQAFVSYSNEVAVGYDYNKKEYYGVSMYKGIPEFQKKLLQK